MNWQSTHTAIADHEGKERCNLLVSIISFSTYLIQTCTTSIYSQNIKGCFPTQTDCSTFRVEIVKDERSVPEGKVDESSAAQTRSVRALTVNL